MVEVRGSFGSVEEWDGWRRELGDFGSLRQSIVQDIRARGFVEPFTGLRRRPHEIVIRDNNLHETVGANGLNSRKRALLAQLCLEMRARGMENDYSLRMLGSDGASRVALILRGLYPYFLGTEYSPTPESAKKIFPIPHMDIANIGYADNSFDVFVGADALKHTADLDVAIREILRVLKPGGLFICSSPFSPSYPSAQAQAPAGPGETAADRSPPESQNNPVVPAASSPRSQLSGWDLLEKLRGWGCSDAYYSTIASSRFGIASDGKPGPFILTAEKAGGEPAGSSRPPNLTFRGALPEKLCTLIALPRSGTTLLASLFAVHSEVEAVYEPWNSRALSDGSDASIEKIAKAEKLPSLAGKTLFVKETAARSVHVDYLRKLHDSAPFAVEKYMILLLRQPEHTFLSEIERRVEWWNDTVVLDAVSLEKWCEKTKDSLRRMLEFGSSARGVAVALEDLAAQPEAIVPQLCARMGLHVEKEQLEYEKHLDKRRVRGDLNVGNKPEKIDVAMTLSRRDKIGGVERLLSGSRYFEWFSAFRALHACVRGHGGIMAIADIPAPVMQAVARPG